MDNVVRLCRICMSGEWNGNLMPIFGEKSEKAFQLFIISGIKVNF